MPLLTTLSGTDDWCQRLNAIIQLNVLCGYSRMIHTQKFY